MSQLRIIMHVDMDAFYASVEMQDHQEFRGQPVIVGGDHARGVVMAASYEARTFGIHSAMPLAKAVRLCPQVIILPPRMERYQSVSRQIMTILGRHTPVLEQVSVDEAYLDFTDRLLAGITVWRIARAIQAEIGTGTGLTCSIGVATSKAVAKMASDPIRFT